MAGGYGPVSARIAMTDSKTRGQIKCTGDTVFCPKKGPHAHGSRVAAHPTDTCRGQTIRCPYEHRTRMAHLASIPRDIRAVWLFFLPKKERVKAGMGNHCSGRAGPAITNLIGEIAPRQPHSNLHYSLSCIPPAAHSARWVLWRCQKR